MRRLGKRKKWLIIIGMVILSLVLFIYFQNKSIGVTNIEYKNTKVPTAFNGYKILHVSDLHNQELSEKLKGEGVKILNNEDMEIKKGEESISLLGVEDPTFLVNDVFDENIKKLMNNKEEELTILLSHRPEYMDVYAKNKVDLVLSGHAHGGQFRIPFVGGVVAPGQGFFPRYTSGMYAEKETSMIVSRGLGNSIIPVRVFNPPELVIVNLKSGK